MSHRAVGLRFTKMNELLPTINLTTFGATDVGLVRTKNEDASWFLPRSATGTSGATGTVVRYGTRVLRKLDGATRAIVSRFG